ncbi:MAG: flagellar assembly protein FliH [Sulfuritalea sp.]|nr:flagellar assembly protein FliH [Azonexus sp.]MCC7310375.1 flagellar assembly protein FliH [Sulfuritalea sp.]
MPQPKPSPTAWKRWELTHFTEAASTATTKARSVMTHLPPDAVAPPPTFADEEIARLREAARQEGYQAGFDSGREAAAATGHELAARLGQAISRFDSGVSQLEQAVASEVLALALEIARKVVHQTIAVKPRIILDVIREALLQMPLQHAMIHLNTEDAALVRAHAGEQLAHAGHRIQDDPQLARGDVVIDTGGAHLNARLATRWQNVIATLGQDTPWLEADETGHS